MGPLGFSNASLAVLAALVFLAGIVDSLAGGGGLITVPAYFAVGLDPRLILGTNKLASCIGTATSSANYMRGRGVRYAELAVPIALGLAGGATGSLLAQRLGPAALRWVMIVLIPSAAAVVYTHHDFGRVDRSAELPARERSRRASLFAFPLGCYDGFFGPGTGMFFALSFGRFCRYDLLGATVRARTLNLATNAAALAAFLLGGRVQWRLGLCMAAASACGNFVGSHLGLKRGAALIRPAILLVCAGLFAKLVADALR